MSLTVRSSGVLLPLFSLPGTAFVGALGRDARRFADFLADAGQHFWQILPINPIDLFHSPYSSRSAFAGESLYLDLDELLDENLLEPNDLDRDAWRAEPTTTFPARSAFPSDSFRDVSAEIVRSSNEPFGKRANYEAAFRFREPCWRKAFDRFQRGIGGERYRAPSEEFRERNRSWLDDFALFETLSRRFGSSRWSGWEPDFRSPRNETVRRFAEENRDELDYYRFLQLVFDVQWREFREYCHSKKIELLGDVPIYVGHASADTWSHPELFQLDANGEMTRVAGVPADDFNPDGQRWNSPLYDWPKHEATGFAWQIARMKTTFDRFDDVRLDHFIGFYNYYSFPARTETTTPDEETASSSTVSATNENAANENVTDGIAGDSEIRVYEPGWRPGPQEKLFDALFQHFPATSFLAEDLGVMNEGVRRLRNRYNLPGMQVLQFVFDEHKPEDGDPSQYWAANSVACTGTHDTPPVLSWLATLEKRGPKPTSGWTTFDYVWTTLRAYRRPEERGDSNESENSESFGETFNGWRYSLPESSPQAVEGVPLQSSPIREDVRRLRKAAIRMVMNSASVVAIFPIQDVLGLGDDARTNFPGFAEGNWLFRLPPDRLTKPVADELKTLTEQGDR